MTCTGAPAVKQLLFAAALLLGAWLTWRVPPRHAARDQCVSARADLVQLVPPSEHRLRSPQRGTRHATFLIYSWNYAMFNQTLRNLLDEGFSRLVRACVLALHSNTGSKLTHQLRSKHPRIDKGVSSQPSLQDKGWVAVCASFFIAQDVCL